MKKIVCFMLLVSFALCGCGLTKKQLGLSRSAPDETSVETRRPLELPPDYNILPE